LAFLVVLLSACQPPDVPPAQTTRHIDLIGVTVAPPGETAIAMATAQATEIYEFKTSEPNLVTLKGRLLITNPMGLLPDENDGIFLVPLSEDQGNISGIPEFKVGEVPQADVDERVGDFVFTNIEPGQYVLMGLTDGGSQMPASHDDGSIVVITVAETARNQVIDLGALNFP